MVFLYFFLAVVGYYAPEVIRRRGAKEIKKQNVVELSKIPINNPSRAMMLESCRVKGHKM
jgi:hypothetical protein